MITAELLTQKGFSMIADRNARWQRLTRSRDETRRVLAIGAGLTPDAVESPVRLEVDAELSSFSIIFGIFKIDLTREEFLRVLAELTDEVFLRAQTGLRYDTI